MSSASVRKRWGVVFASRVVRELRKLERDQSALEIVHKKIRELSNGKFTLENHTIIIGSNKHIPLYRARVANDIRIVYQIDVIADSSGAFDNQVIKVLRISNRAQINYNFWARVSAHLHRRNPLYRERCIHRPPPGDSDEWFPTRFPHEDYGSKESPSNQHLEVNETSDDERNEIQEVMRERFIPLTKALYNSILGDIELALPMVLDDHERQIVSHKGASIVIGRSGTGKTTALIYKMRTIDQTLAAEAQHEGELVKQLFVTRSRVLAQHVEATYRGLVESTSVASKSPKELKALAKQNRENPDRALVEFDSEIDLRSDLPLRFTLLQPSHFPLFISFDKLCSLLEEDIRHQFPDAINDPKTRSIIGFDEFLHKYWPLFGRGLTHPLEPSLVFSEIIGVIKGSQLALDSTDGYLTRDAYIEQLSRRQFPLLAQAREKIYSIFEIYTKHKNSRFDIDAADRTRTILRHLSSIIGEHKVQHLFVDEVQDNLMVDIHFLRVLCDNIHNIYWSGDSAQTVVAGSAFRINDLKAFTYRDQSTRPFGPAVKKAPAQFTTFELVHNFRSLSGIVRYADSIVQAIYRLFPDSIDVMNPESAEHEGLPPVIFEGINDETGFFEKFLLGSSASNRVVFGAQQAILVRDDEAAEQLDSKLQGLCNVMPIMDSKGLEFDDVLIHNFFSCSPASMSAWQCILRDTNPGQQSGRKQPPPPAILCSELKLLYVAITRARHRCWIWDGGEVINALKVFWIARGLVETESASQMVGRLATSSAKSEWVEKGKEFFSHRLYKLAAACFAQAGEPNDAQISRAYHQMARAKLKQLRGDTLDAREALISAAQGLDECTGLSNIGDPKNFHYHAGTCLEAVQEIYPAAQSFAKAGHHEHAVQILFDVRDFDHGAEFLLNGRRNLNVALFERFLGMSRYHFFTRRQYRRLPPLFDYDLDAQISYARKPEFRPQLKHILDSNKRYNELAEVHIGEGDLDQGVSCYLKAFEFHRSTDSIRFATDVAVASAEAATLIDGRYRKNAHGQARRLIETVQPYLSALRIEARSYVDFLYSILSRHPISLDWVQVWRRDRPLQRRKRILALHFAVDDDKWIEGEPFGGILRYLDAWKEYSSGIMELANLRYPSRSAEAQALFGFFPIGSNPSGSIFRVIQDSFLFQSSSSEGYQERSGRAIDELLAKSIPQRLIDRLHRLHKVLIGSSVTFPHRSHSLLSPRPQPSLISAAGSDHEINNCAQIISRLLPSLDIVTGRERVIVIRDWLQRLFDIARPISATNTDLRVLRNYFDLDASTPTLIKWLKSNLSKIWTASASSIWPNFLVTLSLSLGLALDREVLYTVTEIMQSNERQPDSSSRLDLVRDLIPLFEGSRPDRLVKALYTLRALVPRDTGVPANILVSFIELLTQELLFNDWKLRNSAQFGFSGLLIPLSWAKELVERHSCHNPLIVPPWQRYFDDIETFSRTLRSRRSDQWSLTGQKVEPTMIHELKMRLCWCIALVTVNFGPDSFTGLAGLQCLKRIANEQSSNAMASAPYNVFATITSRQSCLEALGSTLSHESMAVISIANPKSRFSGFSRFLPRKGGRRYSGAQYRAVCYNPTDALSIITSIGFLANNGKVRTRAALVIQAAWTKYSVQRWPDVSRTLSMENRCHRVFNELGLSHLYAESKAQLYIARGPLLALWVALEWLGEEMRLLAAKYRRSGDFSTIHQPSFLFAQRIDHMTQDLLTQLSSGLRLHRGSADRSDIVTTAYSLFEEVAEKDLFSDASDFRDVDSWLRACSAAAV